jgi:hypothetical protein
MQDLSSYSAVKSTGLYWHLAPEYWHLAPEYWHLAPEYWHLAPEYCTYHIGGLYTQSPFAPVKACLRVSCHFLGESVCVHSHSSFSLIGGQGQIFSWPGFFATLHCASSFSNREFLFHLKKFLSVLQGTWHHID